MAAGAVAGGAFLAVTQASAGAVIGTSFGRLGTVIESQAGKITGFIRDGIANPYHGLDQAITRGVIAGTILNTVKSPLVTLQQAGGNIMYLTRQAAVVLNDAGRVVTTYGASQLQQHVVDVLKAVSK